MDKDEQNKKHKKPLIIGFQAPWATVEKIDNLVLSQKMFLKANEGF